MSSDTAILILSCDKYADAWQPFFDLFHKFWPDCEFPVYLGTNEKSFNSPTVKVIHSGKAADWSTDTKNILEQIPEKYIIVLLEDYFLQNPVDKSWLKECVNYMKENDAAFMRIASFRKDHFPMYAFDIDERHPRFGINRKNTSYRVNLQGGIWNTKDLIALIKEGESPWEFEVKGSERSNASEKLFAGIVESAERDILTGPVPYLCTAITKGTWMREAIELCKKEKIHLDLTIRPVESRLAFSRRKFYHALPFGVRKYLDFFSAKFR
jgi:hypothetical protein